MAARFDGCPWHIYCRLPAPEKAEILATFQEHNLREGVYHQRLKARQDKEKGSGRSTIGVEDYL